MKQVIFTLIAILTLGFAANAQTKGNSVSLENATAISFQNAGTIISSETAQAYTENINRFKKDVENPENATVVNYIPQVITVTVSVNNLINELVKANNACYTATAFAIVANSNTAVQQF